MKNNKIIKLSALLLGVSVVLSGCVKETFPKSGYATSDQVAESPFALDGLVASVPTILITNYLGTIGEHIDFGYASIFGATDRLAGEVFPVSQNVAGGNQYYDRWQFAMYPASTGLSPTGYGITLFWNNYYQFIKATNDVIATVGTADGLKKERGIAKTFRALYYLDMARLFDALDAKAPNKVSYETEVKKVAGLTVPLITEATTMDEAKNNPRVKRDVMFKFIFEDLNDAEECLAGYTPTAKSQPTLAVVYGLKARAYLWLGGFDGGLYEDVPTGEAAYRKAAEYARKAIDASGCTIMTEEQWTDPKTGFNTVNSAWMWAMMQSTDTVIGNLLTWSAHMCPEAVYGYGNRAQPGLSVFSYARLSSSDFRKNVFVTADRDYSKIKPYTSLTEAQFNGKDPALVDATTIAPYASFKFHTAGGEKESYKTANVTDIPMMRVEEMYLIEAEATAHYDAATGKSLLVSFMANRDASYAFPSARELVDEIIFQKRIEFWGEGIIFYDMKRLDMSMHNGDTGSNAPSAAKVTTDGRSPFWNICIPYTAVAQNSALTDMNNPDPTATVKSK